MDDVEIHPSSRPRSTIGLALPARLFGDTGGLGVAGGAGRSLLDPAGATSTGTTSSASITAAFDKDQIMHDEEEEEEEDDIIDIPSPPRGRRSSQDPHDDQNSPFLLQPSGQHQPSDTGGRQPHTPDLYLTESTIGSRIGAFPAVSLLGSSPPPPGADVSSAVAFPTGCARTGAVHAPSPSSNSASSSSRMLLSASTGTSSTSSLRNETQTRPPLSVLRLQTPCKQAATSSSSAPAPTTAGRTTRTTPQTPIPLLSSQSLPHHRKRTSDQHPRHTGEEEINNLTSDSFSLSSASTSSCYNSSSFSCASASMSHPRQQQHHNTIINAKGQHLSPSIMTMDGRILQSQNPFSSPIVVECTNFMMPDGSAPSIPPMYNCPNTAAIDATKLRRTNASTDVGTAKYNHSYGYGSNNINNNNNHTIPPLLMKSHRTTIISSSLQHQPPHPPKTPFKKKKPIKNSPTWLQPKSSTSGYLYSDHATTTANSTTMTTTDPSRFANDFDVIQQLGQGHFGTVVSVMSRLDGCLYAVKMIPNGDMQEVYALAALSEVTIDEPATFHIVRYHQSWREGTTVFIQTELCSGNVANCQYDSINPQRLLYQMSMALEFIHRHDMCHLDIKPENIFIKNNQYKLGDFGLVTTRAASPKFVQEGDSRYMSLELLHGNFTDLTKCDIFSLGISVYEIVTQVPLPSSGDYWHQLRHGLFPSYYQQHGSNNNTKRNVTTTTMMTEEEVTTFMSILYEMMQKNANLRPTAADLLLRNNNNMHHGHNNHHPETMLMTQNNQILVPPPPQPSRQVLTRANTWSGAGAATRLPPPPPQPQRRLE